MSTRPLSVSRPGSEGAAPLGSVGARVGGEWRGLGGGGGASAGVFGYDFRLHSAGDPLPEDFIFYSGTWLFALDGQEAGRVGLRSRSSLAFAGWNTPGEATDMEVVTLSMHGEDAATNYRRCGTGLSYTSNIKLSAIKFNVNDLQLRRFVSTTGSLLGGSLVSPSVPTLVPTYIRIQRVGGTLKSKFWAVDAPEPAEWHVTYEGVSDPGGLAGMCNERAGTGALWGTHFWIGVSLFPETTPAPLSGEVTPVNAV
jgi:hypothetical protein